MEDNLLGIFLENDLSLHSSYYMIKLCFINSYNVFHIPTLMLLFSKFIPHPEKTVVRNTRKLSYIKLVRYDIYAIKWGYFPSIFIIFFKNQIANRIKIHGVERKKKKYTFVL